MLKSFLPGLKPADTSHPRFSNLIRLWRGTILIVAALVCVGTYATLDTNAHENGITGCTQKSNNNGCYCHCTSNNSNTAVTLTSSSGSSPLTTATNTTYSFTIEVANSGEVDGGCDIASYSGNGLAAGSDGLQAENGELTHENPKSFGGNGHCTWSFTYTTGSTAGWDTLYATGNAVNGDGDDDCYDEWNWAPKFIIHTVTPPVRMALSRTSIPLGQLRVGHRIADSLKVTSNGQDAITISSSAMKTGTYFSSYPTTSNRTINPGSSEIDSVIFSPTVHGSFSDSLIFNTNSDTVPEQRMGLAVSGQGIQAIFNSTNGTSLSFGNLHAGDTEHQTFSFSNTGDDTLFLQTPSISGTGFTIVSEPSTLTFPPNQSGSVVVKFVPTAKQSYSGTLTFSALNGVSVPTVSLSGAGILPEIQISNSDDLGSIRVNQTLQGTVTFQNIGNDILHLSNASLTQPSTLFSLGSYDQTVLPGANGTVHISYTPNAVEPDTSVLQFSTDDPTDSAVAVTITGNGILPRMSVPEADDTVKLGQIKVNSFATASVSVTNNGGADLTLSGVTAGPPPFNLSSSLNVVSAGTTGTITVGFSPTDTGTFTGKLVIHGDDPNNPSDTVYLSGIGINSALSINPGSLAFGQVPVLASVLDTITLSDSGKANVTIYSVQLSPVTGAFSIVGTSPAEVIAGETAIIVLRFQPDTAGTYSGSLALTTDDVGAPTRTINLNGVGIKDPFTVTPSSLNFGQVPVSNVVNDTITMNNTGTTSVTISSYQLSYPSTGFAVIDSSAHVVSPGGTANVIVSFDPASAIGYSGSLMLNTSDVSSPLRTISLSGTGIKGSLTVTPFQINFGNVLLGHDSSTHTELRNAGQASVTISSIALTGPASSAFSDGSFSTPLSIGVGDSISMNLSFTPESPENYEDTVHLTLGDGTAINIVLVGDGVNSGVSETNINASNFSLSLSPNPAEHSVNVHISLPQDREAFIDMFDALGRAVVHMPLGLLSEGAHDIAIPIETLPSGGYFVRIAGPDGNAVQAALIIEKE